MLTCLGAIIVTGSLLAAEVASVPGPTDTPHIRMAKTSDPSIIIIELTNANTNFVYQLQRCTNSVSAVWTDDGSAIPGPSTGGTILWPRLVDEPHEFFRVEVH